MGDGPQNKIAFVIQARMHSSRLPGKILLPIPLNNGKPLIQWIIEELKKSVYNADIYVATSKNKENDVLEAFCNKHSIHCFRGPEENVLSRFISIANNKSYHSLVRLTADNPIIDIKILDETIACHLENKNHYTNTTSLPTGMNFEIIASKAFIAVDEEQLTLTEKEHVTLFLKNNDQYKKMIYTPEVNPQLKPLRLTVDYPSDLIVAATVLSFYDGSSNNVGLSLVANTLNEFPFIFQINQHNIQKRQFTSEQQELHYAIDLMYKLELNYSARILETYEKKDTL